MVSFISAYMSELRTMEADFTKHSMRGIHEHEEINPNAPILFLSPLSQGCHTPGNSWKLLEFQHPPGNSWKLLEFS